jgi:hypothetical protein
LFTLQAIDSTHPTQNTKHKTQNMMTLSAQAVAEDPMCLMYAQLPPEPTVPGEWDLSLLPQYAEDLVLLEPFAHQVAGHEAFVKAAGGLLCKVLQPRELVMIVRMSHEHPSMREFLPSVLGWKGYTAEHIVECVKIQPGIQMAPWAVQMHEKLLSRSETTEMHNILTTCSSVATDAQHQSG